MNRFVAVSVAAGAAAAMAGCSSSQEPQPPGVLPPGTAQVVVDDNDAGKTVKVSCSQVSWTTLIEIGDDDSGARVAMQTDRGFTPTSVQINDLAGFTGAYWQDTVGEATASRVSDTYKISGTARGYTNEDPNKDVMKPFEITANC